ncbi:MAG: hypothetical protein OEY20_08710 [Gemmatimonadota bacterium]|nr:hypothetical protein [Gemmatimonadota bacterium]
MIHRRLFHWSEVALGCLILVLGARIFLLHRQFAAARSEVAHLRSAHAVLQSETRLLAQEVRNYRQLAQSSRITVGTNLRGFTPGGSAVTLRLANLQTPYLFFTIDEKCALCSTWRAFLRASARERPCSLSVVGIALNDVPAPAWDVDSTGFDLIVSPSGTGWTTRALETPATAILVAPEGRFLGRWAGDADPRWLAEIRQAVLTTCTTQPTRSEDSAR